MKIILKQFKQLLITAAVLLCFMPCLAQVKHKLKPNPAPVKPVYESAQLKTFHLLAAQANVSFLFPKGFKEIAAPDNEDFSFDYAMELPGKDFEIWLQVKSQKENWNSYLHAQDKPSTRVDNPDSVYVAMGAANAIAFTGDKKYFVRNITPEILARFNADAGKSYLLTLLDMAATKRYRYALLITLQKSHTGTILAVCFTNEKGPEFYKNIDRASNCVKFKS